MDPFVYQYSVGGLVFAIGLVYAWRQGYVGLDTPQRRWALTVLLGGLFAVLGLQAYLQYAPMSEAEAVPFKGGGVFKSEGFGTGLDYGVMAVYGLAIMAVGTYFGRNQKSTRDFFFAGQRFSWWILAFSLVATTVGSYSFVKYSKVAYGYGLASSQTYLNDWFWMPLLIFGWLPILYFSRVTSIPEYFERRFDTRTRRAVTVLLLVYLVGYVGINLFTMGTALNVLLGWPIPLSALIIAAISAVYVTAGGQTSVIMTDLFQGVILLIAGALILGLGAYELGGLDGLWSHLPRGHRQAFAGFNDDPSYHSVGIFWQDAMANSAMFYFLNQGILMRFMAARSIKDGRRAAVAVLLILMPLSAAVVASGGWVGKALEHAGILPGPQNGKEVFFTAARYLARPGVFGLIMAALIAALMSTVDSLVTAVAAIAVNDVYKPLKPEATEAEQLRMARISSLLVSAIGVAIVPIFMMFDSIYAAHGAFTAAVTPPLVIALLFGVFWKRFSAPAAFLTLIGGSLAILASIVYPGLIAPFAHGVPAAEIGDGFFEGARQYKFMRALYGLAVSGAIGLVTGLVFRPADERHLQGLVWGRVAEAIAHFKGAPGVEKDGARGFARLRLGAEAETSGAAELPRARLSKTLAEALGIAVGDAVLIQETRGFARIRAGQVFIAALSDEPEPVLELGPQAADSLGFSGPGAELAVSAVC